MSLIQEALKRQAEDAEKSGAGKTTAPVQATAPVESAPERVSVRRSAGATQTGEPPPPVEPPPAPPPLPEPVAPPPAKNRKMAILAIAAVVLLIVGGGVWLLFMQPKKAPAPVAPPSAKKAPTAQVPSSSPAPSVATSVTPPASTPPPTVTATTIPPETSASTGPKIEPVAAPATPVQIEPVPALPVVWPSLMLSGVIGKGPRGAARINNDIVAVNETIQGVKILSVGNQGVELEYMGEKKLLKVGSSTQ